MSSSVSFRVGILVLVLASAGVAPVWADGGTTPDITITTEYPPVPEGEAFGISIYTDGGAKPSFLPIPVFANVTASGVNPPTIDAVKTVLGGSLSIPAKEITDELQSVDATPFTSAGSGEYFSVINAGLMEFQPAARSGTGIFGSEVVRTVAIATEFDAGARTVSGIDEYSEFDLEVSIHNNSDIDSDGNHIPDATALLSDVPLTIIGPHGSVTVATPLNTPARGASLCGADTVFMPTASGPIAIDVTAPCLADLQAEDPTLSTFDTARLVMTISPAAPESTLDGPAGVAPLSEFALTPLPLPKNVFVRANILLTTVAVPTTRATPPTWTSLTTLPGIQRIVVDLSGPGIDAVLVPGAEVAAYTYDVTLTQSAENLTVAGNKHGWTEINSLTFPALRSATVATGDNIVEFTSNNASAIYGTNVAPRVDTGEPGPNGNNGMCFVATAAYGTPMAAQLKSLRAVRDEFMIGNPFGAAFVDSYYRVSPPVAGVVSENNFVRALVRLALAPILVLSGWLLASPGTFAVAVLSAIAMAAAATLKIRRSKST